MNLKAGASDTSTPNGADDAPVGPPWYLTPVFRKVIVVVFGVVLIVSAIYAIGYKDNQWHYGLGRGMLAGHIYARVDGKPLGDHYLPGRAVIDATVSWLPFRTARAVVFIAAVLAFAVTVLRWRRLANYGDPRDGPITFAVGAATLAILSPFILRDLNDCGLQMLLLFMLTAAVLAVHDGKAWRVGLWLALATTYKANPLLFLPLLIYKRRWREPLWMVLFLVLLNLVAPALFLSVRTMIRGEAASPIAALSEGWSASIDANVKFLTRIKGLASNKDPSTNPVEPPRHRNRNLKVALARFVQTYPPGHDLFIAHPEDVNEDGTLIDNPRPHPGFVQFLDLPTRAANYIVTALILVLAAVLAWRFRHRWRGKGDALNLAAEWAAVCLVSALLSPLCWGQHLVVAVPAMYLVIHTGLGRPSARWRDLAGAFIAIVVLLPIHALFGEKWTEVIASYKLQTAALLLLVLLVLTLRRSAAAETTADLDAAAE